MKINNQLPFSVNYIRGFTLIELLVVISIIGLLSSVVLVSLQSAREKGKIGAGIKFDTYNYHAFGADALGMWSFDTLNGSVVPNQSQYNSSLTLNGGAFLTSNNGGIMREALNLSGSGQYARSTILIPFSDTNFTGFTISVWIKPTVCNSFCRVLGFEQYYKDLYIRNLSGNYTAGISVLETLSAPIKLSEWLHLSGTCVRSTRKCTLYINGKEVSSVISTASVGNLFQNSGISVGSFHHATNHGDYFSGMIDEVRIYSQSLIASEVQRLYAEGAKKHGIAINQ